MTCYKKISLAVVEGDYALSVNNCQADAIPAAQSVVENGWVARAGGGGKYSGHCSQAGHGVGRRLQRLSEDILSLLSETQGCGKHRGCGRHISQLSNSGSPHDITELVPLFHLSKTGVVVKFKFEFCFNRVTSQSWDFPRITVFSSL